MMLSLLIKLPTYYVFRLYNSIWKYASTYEVWLILSAVAVSNILLQIVIHILDMRLPISIACMLPLLDAFFIVGVRFSYRLSRRMKQGIAFRRFPGRRVLIMGAGAAGVRLIQDMQAHRTLGLTPIAAVDDDPSKRGMHVYGVPVVGNRYDLPDRVIKFNIEEVIIAIPELKQADFNEIVDLCVNAGCRVRALPALSQLIDGTVLATQLRDVKIEDLLGRKPIQLDLPEKQAFLQHRTVLITGAGGSIGSELARQLALYNPEKMVLLDNYENNLFDIQNELSHMYPELELETVVANIREAKRLVDIFKRVRPHVVFHAAAHKHVPLMEGNPGEAVKNNIYGTLNLGRAAMAAKVKRFVLISTDKAVNPTNIMGATKRVAEMIIQTLNQEGITQFAAVRFGNVLGSNGSVIPTFQRQIAAGGPVTVTHREITRYFMTIPEAAQLVIQAGIMAQGGEIFVLDMGKPVKIYELAKRMIRLSGYEPETEIPIEVVGLRPGEKLYEELLLDEEGLAATKNDKIYVLQPCGIEPQWLWKEVAEVLQLADGKTGPIRKQLRRLVPSLHWEDGD
jgi:FlaA1/EpsC-like NDP-sugar epimerase